MRPTSASLLIAEDCNMACTYCFEKSKKKILMSKETCLHAISTLFNNYTLNALDGDNTQTDINLMIFGGEPLLNPDVFEAGIKFALDLSAKTTIPFSFSIVTNGTLVDERFVSFMEYIDKQFPHVNKHIQFSIDGVGASHDISRIFPDGSGTFSTIEHNLETYFHRISKFSSIHECVTSKNVSSMYDSFVYFYKRFGCDKQWFMPICDEDFKLEDTITYQNELIKIVDYLKNAGDIKTLKNLPPASSVNKCHNTGPHKPCGAGTNFCSVTATGDIYPCHEFYYNDDLNETKLGSLNDGIDVSAQRFYVKYDVRDLSCHTGDKQCENASLCYICIADNYMRKNNPLSNIIRFKCKFTAAERHVFEYAKAIISEEESKCH